MSKLKLSSNSFSLPSLGSPSSDFSPRPIGALLGVSVSRSLSEVYKCMTVIECLVDITASVRDQNNDKVPKITCALFNSGGGLVRMINKVVSEGGSPLPRELDTWWSGMERQLVYILSRDDLCNFCDLVGGAHDPELLLFVTSGPYLCSVDFHCRLPTDTAVHRLSHESALQILATSGSKEVSLDSLPLLSYDFVYGQVAPGLTQETPSIQFKLRSGGGHAKDVPNGIVTTACRYVSAFGCHAGGHVIFGVEDGTSKVMGEIMDDETIAETELRVKGLMSRLIWGDVEVKPRRGTHWQFRVCHVRGAPPREGPEQCVVLVLSISPIPGGVFTSCPESYVIRDGGVEPLDFPEWRDLMLRPAQRCSYLEPRLTRVPVPLPGAPVIYGQPHVVNHICHKLLPVSKGFRVLPAELGNTLLPAWAAGVLGRVAEHFRGDETVVVPIAGWGWTRLKNEVLKRVFGGTDEESPFPREGGSSTGSPEPGSFVDLLVLSASTGLLVLSIWREVSPLSGVYCRHLGDAVRVAVVGMSEASCKFVSHAAVVGEGGGEDEIRAALTPPPFPPGHGMSGAKLGVLRRGLALVLGAYEALPCQLPPPGYQTSTPHHLVVTPSELWPLWAHQTAKQLWLHGSSGTGKTLTALLWLRELRERGADIRELLYVCENQRLADFVGRQGICTSVTRRYFLFLHDQRPCAWDHVTTVVVDDAQHMKASEGDWYGLIRRLMRASQGHLWVLLDEGCKVHRYDTGLPARDSARALVTHVRLDETLRGVSALREYTRDLRRRRRSPAVSRDSVHPGVAAMVSSVTPAAKGGAEDRVKVVAVNDASVSEAVCAAVQRLVGSGHPVEGIAVLLGSSSNTGPTEQRLRQRMASLPHVDTLKGFSGLEAPYVVGTTEGLPEDKADLTNYLANLAGRASEQLLLVMPSSRAASRASSRDSSGGKASIDNPSEETERLEDDEIERDDDERSDWARQFERQWSGFDEDLNPSLSGIGEEDDDMQKTTFGFAERSEFVEGSKHILSRSGKEDEEIEKMTLELPKRLVVHDHSKQCLSEMWQKNDETKFAEKLEFTERETGIGSGEGNYQVKERVVVSKDQGLKPDDEPKVGMSEEEKEVPEMREEALKLPERSFEPVGESKVSLSGKGDDHKAVEKVKMDPTNLENSDAATGGSEGTEGEAVLKRSCDQESVCETGGEKLEGHFVLQVSEFLDEKPLEAKGCTTDGREDENTLVPGAPKSSEGLASCVNSVSSLSCKCDPEDTFVEQPGNYKGSDIVNPDSGNP